MIFVLISSCNRVRSLWKVSFFTFTCLGVTLCTVMVQKISKGNKDKKYGRLGYGSYTLYFPSLSCVTVNFHSLPLISLWTKLFTKCLPRLSKGNNSNSALDKITFFSTSPAWVLSVYKITTGLHIAWESGSDRCCYDNTCIIYKTALSIA